MAGLPLANSIWLPFLECVLWQNEMCLHYKDTIVSKCLINTFFCTHGHVNKQLSLFFGSKLNNSGVSKWPVRDRALKTFRVTSGWPLDHSSYIIRHLARKTSVDQQRKICLYANEGFRRYAIYYWRWYMDVLCRGPRPTVTFSPAFSWPKRSRCWKSNRSINRDTIVLLPSPKYVCARKEKKICRRNDALAMIFLGMFRQEASPSLTWQYIFQL